MSHDEAVEIILTHLLQQPVAAEELNAAKAHLAGCGACRDETNDLMSLLRGKAATLRAEAENLVACSQIRRRLPDFVSGILDPAHPTFGLIERHISICKNCVNEKELLAGLIADANAALEQEIPGKPFGIELAPGPALWEMVQNGVKRLRQQLQILIEEDVPRFVELPGLKLAEILAPAPDLLPATRSLPRGEALKTISGPVLQKLEIADDEANLAATLKLITDKALEVKFTSLDGSREIEATTVKLVEKWTGQPVDSQRTNHEGKATLRNMDFISTREYLLQIRHAAGQWEVEISGKRLIKKIPEVMKKNH